MKKIFLASFLSLSTLYGQENNQPVQDIKSFFEEKTTISEPLKLRDPFKINAKIKKKKKAKVSKKARFDKGVFTNQLAIEALNISNLKIVGILVGKDRRALAKTKQGVVILKEGMKIGTEKAELKAILPGGIILVEKITNVYGQIEYLETIIPISEEDA